jgi:hypothetical protein
MAQDAEKIKADPAMKGRRHRSPNYPLISLPKAMERAEALWRHDKTHKVPLRVAVSRWSYKPQSSIGVQTVAALKAYGLIDVSGEGENRLIGVTERARRIVLKSDDATQLKQEAALSPAILRDIWDRYREEGLPSDDVISHFLQLHRHFNENAIPAFLANLRETFAYASLGSPGIMPDVKETSDELQNCAREELNPLEHLTLDASVTGGNLPKAGIYQDVFNLEEGKVVLQCPAELSPKSLGFLVDWIGVALRRLGYVGAPGRSQTEPL